MPRQAGAETIGGRRAYSAQPVSYTHLRAHETVLDLVCRLLLEKKQQEKKTTTILALLYMSYITLFTYTLLLLLLITHHKQPRVCAH